MRHLYLSLIFLLLPFTALAAFNTVTFSGTFNISLTVGGTDLNFVVSSDSKLESFTTSSDNTAVTITVSDGSYFSITNTNKKAYTVTTAVSGGTVSESCLISTSQLDITPPSGMTGTGTYTITPSTSACTAPTSTATGGGISGGGGGGGGGSSASSVVVTSTPVLAEAVTPVVAPAPKLLTPVPAPAEQPTKPALLTSASLPMFNTDLEFGANSSAVSDLQKLLASDPSVYPEGLITGYYGSLTRLAVQKFQLKYKVILTTDAPGNGRLGPKTREKIADVFKTTPASVSSDFTAPTALFKSGLGLRANNNDVERLQRLLATDKDIYPEGLVSGYFGALTERAVQRFQVKYGVAVSGDSGFGYVGPKTRVKLQEVFGKTSSQ